VKNKVSELMDGELSDREAEKIIAALKQEDLLSHNWEIYHLIGDTLRQSSKIFINNLIRLLLPNSPERRLERISCMYP
jgi:sigma-E factor negative regulatory protein RseA